MIGTPKQSWCVTGLMDTFDREMDMISWESFMNDGGGRSTATYDVWLRGVVSSKYNYVKPFFICSTIGESRKCACCGGNQSFSFFYFYFYFYVFMFLCFYVFM